MKNRKTRSIFWRLQPVVENNEIFAAVATLQPMLDHGTRWKLAYDSQRVQMCEFVNLLLTCIKFLA